MPYPISEFQHTFFMSFLDDSNKNACSFVYKSIFIKTKHLLLTLKIFLLKLCYEKNYYYYYDLKFT